MIYNQPSNKSFPVKAETYILCSFGNSGAIKDTSRKKLLKTRIILTKYLKETCTYFAKSFQIIYYDIFNFFSFNETMEIHLLVSPAEVSILKTLIPLDYL